MSGRNGVTVGNTGYVVSASAARGTSVSSSHGPVAVQTGGIVTAHGNAQVSAGSGQPTTIDGTVSSTGRNGRGRGFNVIINGGVRRPGNVSIGKTGLVSATGEVFIRADTLVVKGTIKAHTLQKKVKTCIPYFPPGSIDIDENFKNKIDTVYTNQDKSDPSVPSESGSEGGVTGEDHCYIDLSAAPRSFEATNSVRIATGALGTIDMRGNPPGIPVVACPGPIELYADNILLDPGVLLTDICGPGPVTSGPARPIYDVSTLCVCGTVGHPFRHGEVDFLVTNMGNAPDSFFVSVEVTIPVVSAQSSDTNEVYILVESQFCTGLAMADTVTVIRGDATGVGDGSPVYTDIAHRCYPNPFNPDVTIRFTVPEPGGRTTVVVYDVQGRRVKRLTDARLSTGLYERRWDGRNDDGEPVASGVYIYRITSAAKTAQGKMVLLR